MTAVPGELMIDTLSAHSSPADQPEHPCRNLRGDTATKGRSHVSAGVLAGHSYFPKGAPHSTSKSGLRGTLYGRDNGLKRLGYCQALGLDITLSNPVLFPF